jgi:hypothetical protein
MPARLEGRIARAEEVARGAVPPRSWFRIVAPDVMTDADFEAWRAEELAKLPADARVIVRRII